MAKPRIVSMKRFVKGLNSGTGALTQPPGTVTRISNMGFSQRGSLQTVNGSAIIGVLNSPYTEALAVGTYSNLVSGQYPYYPALAAPVSYLLPNVTNIIATPGGSSGNAAGTYTFSIYAVSSVGHSDPSQGVVTITPTMAFGNVVFSWQADANAATFSVYYLPNGVGGQGVLLTSTALNTYTFTGTLPTTPLVTLPLGNTSYQLQLQIGNISAPSKQVFFAATNAMFPGTPPLPAQVSPGDPNFQFQDVLTSTSNYAGGSGSISAVRSASGSSTQNSSAFSAFPSVALASGQSVTFSMTASGQVTIGATDAGYGTLGFQYSTDGGTTWTFLLRQTYPTTTTYGPTVLTGSTSALTNLDNLKFRVQAVAVYESGVPGSDGVETDVNVSASSATITTSESFTPYGGLANFVEPIPQILQFDQLSILILGNGYQPQSCNPALLSAATCSALTNTFQSTYPDWQANVVWVAGTAPDIIAVLVGGVNYVYTCIQGGTSGATEPTFPTALGATVDDGQVVWKNTGPLVASVAPRGAAHGIVYEGSLWLANTSPETTSDQIDGPTCIKMSDSDNPNSWNPVNTAFLGKDDGTQITGITSFTIAEVGIAPTGSLVAFKEFSTYQILGVFGATDFAITQAQTDLGCIAARSIQFLSGYGIIRLTHLGFAIFDGVKDRLISEEIRPYLYGGSAQTSDITGIDFTYCYLSQGTQSSIPPMYVCACPIAGASGAMTRLFLYDLVLKAWTIIDLPWAIRTLLQARTGEGNPLTIGFRGDGTGILERFFTGDLSWDAASLVSTLTPSQTAITWAFTTVFVYSEGSSKRAFYREVVVRGYSSQAVASLVTVTVQSDGNPGVSYQVYLEPQPFSGQFELSIDLLFTAQIVNMSMTGTGVVTVDGMDWKVSEKQGGRLMIG